MRETKTMHDLVIEIDGLRVASADLPPPLRSWETEFANQRIVFVRTDLMAELLDVIAAHRMIPHQRDGE